MDNGMDFFGDALVETGKVSDPMAQATQASPARGVFRLSKMILTTTSTATADKAKAAGFVEAGDPSEKEAAGVVRLNESGHTHLRLEGSFHFDAVGDDVPTPIERISTLWPIAKSAEMTQDSFAGWVRRADKVASPIFATLGHPLAFSPKMQRLMPKVSIADEEGLGSGPDLLAVLTEIIGALTGQTIDVIGLGAYRGTDKRGRDQPELASL